MKKEYKFLKFNGKVFMLIDRFIYKDKEYLYIVEDKSEELDKLENIEDFEGNIEIDFLTKCEDGEYETVVDNDLVQRLLKKVGMRFILGKNDA